MSIPTTAGLKVLVIGKAVPGLPYETKHLTSTKNILAEISQFVPDVILTIDYASAALNAASFEIRKRWLTPDPKAPLDDMIRAIEFCYRFNLWTTHQHTKSNPLISVYTGAYNTGDFLRDTYQSLKEQTYPTWEWVVVDDFSVDGTWERLQEFARDDHRVRPFRSGKPLRKIGMVKDAATRLCRGEYLVELDHDDMLTDFALAEIKKAFEEHPDAGFVYSNCTNFYESGEFQRFDGPDWVNRYRWTEYRGKKWLECINPDVYERFGPEHYQQFGWFLTVGPNHVRAYRAATLRELGGYNPHLPVADDWDLYARAFLRSKCFHIDKMLYLYRFLDGGVNTTWTRNKSIQDHLAHGRINYGPEFVEFNKRRLAGTAGVPEVESPGAAAPASAAVPPEPAQPGRVLGLADVSFVVLEAVPTPLTERCLASVRKWAPGAEIVLVENGTPPREEVSKLADKVVSLEDNVRYAGGCNAGAEVASRKILCFLNNDAEFVDETPARLLAGLKEPVGIVGPYSNCAKPPQGSHAKAQPADRDVEMIVGVCLMVSAERFRALGGFDSRLYTYEDDDLCFRAADVGAKSRVIGGTWVNHDGHVTLKARGDDEQALIKANGAIFQKKRQKIRVIAIAKDEENCIREYFEQFRFVTTDWCLFDTGSTDKTVEIAESIGVKVKRGFLTDFASARNEAKRLFADGCDWFTFLDPDERLCPEMLAGLQELVFRTGFDLFYAPLRAIYPNGTTKFFVPKPFLFRNVPELEWTGLVHEKPIGTLKQAMIMNGRVDHILAHHANGRREEAAAFYNGLAARDPYHTDPVFKAELLKKWPLPDYDRLTDPRIKEIYTGPLVSVVIPTYKRPELLRRAVESALAQDYEPLEVVVVGDACSDLAAQEWLKESDRVRVYNLARNHNDVGSAARNHAIRMAAGELIADLDSDNVWLPNHVSSVVTKVLEKKAAWGFSSMQIEGGKDLKFRVPEFQGVDTSTLVYRKTLIAKYGGWRHPSVATYATDWDVVKRWMEGKESWVCTEMPTLVYNAETSNQRDTLVALAEKRNG